jgi:hypothetical protein
MISELCEYQDLRFEMGRRKFLNIPFDEKEILELIYKVLKAL